MADDIVVNAGVGGVTIAADDIGGIKYQRVKLIHGADGVNDGDVSAANKYPVKDNVTDPVTGGVKVNGSFTINVSTISATGTGTSSSATRGYNWYSEIMCQIDCTQVATGTSPQLDVYLQSSSEEVPSNWDDIACVTFTTAVARKIIRFSGEAATTTSVSAAQDAAMMSGAQRQGAWGGNLRIKYVYTSSSPAGSYIITVKGVVKNGSK